MTKQEALVNHCIRVQLAALPTERMKALYALRQFLNDTDPLELFISVEVSLSDLDVFIPEGDKDSLRSLGYQFPEDFDEPKKMFCE